MQVRAGHPPALAHPPDQLPPCHGLARCHQRLAEVEVTGNDALAMVQIHHLAGEIEIGDQCDDPGVGRSYRSAALPGEVGSEMPALDLAVERPRGPEPTGDPATINAGTATCVN